VSRRERLLVALKIPVDAWDCPTLTADERAAPAPPPVRARSVGRPPVGHGAPPRPLHVVAPPVAASCPVDVPEAFTAPREGARTYRREGQRLLRAAVEIHGRAEVARAAGVVVGSINQYLGGIFFPGAAPRARLLVAYEIGLKAWEADPLVPCDPVPPAPPTHEQLLEQLRASLAAHELAAVASTPAPVDAGLDLGDEEHVEELAPLTETRPIASTWIDVGPVPPDSRVRRRFGLGLGRFARVDVEQLLAG
jgi:hypothetical protein